MLKHVNKKQFYNFIEPFYSKEKKKINKLTILICILVRIFQKKEKINLQQQQQQKKQQHLKTAFNANYSIKKKNKLEINQSSNRDL